MKSFISVSLIFLATSLGAQSFEELSKVSPKHIELAWCVGTLDGHFVEMSERGFIDKEQYLEFMAVVLMSHKATITELGVKGESMESAKETEKVLAQIQDNAKQQNLDLLRNDSLYLDNIADFHTCNVKLAIHIANFDYRVFDEVYADWGYVMNINSKSDVIDMIDSMVEERRVFMESFE